MTLKKLTAAEQDKLQAAVVSLRNMPSFAVFDGHLKWLLDDLKNALVFNSSSAVPTLQGRAQQLQEIIDILNRK